MSSHPVPSVPAPRRVARVAGGLIAALLGLSLLTPGCRVGYVIKSAWFQAELLASRQRVDRVRARGGLTGAQVKSLDLIADVKRYGEEMGLSPTHNYDSVALNWKREIWNVTGCDPISFQPRTWWFPIVGRVPYLGYFREQDATRMIDRMKGDGLDVYMRTAGAYSTLGWFRDPILMPMLEWSTYDLADTVLHELAHATLWVPGSVGFNESFASFVGEEAAFGYLADRFGPDSAELRLARDDFEDIGRWRDVQFALFQDLDAVYTDPFLSDEEKLRRKSALFEAFPGRVATGGFHRPERFARAAGRGVWNNARLIQFRTYNANRAWFEAILARNDGDLLRFMEDIGRVAREDKDPFVALERAATGTVAAEPGGAGGG